MRPAWVLACLVLMTWVVAVPGGVRAQDFERPGVYLSGSWSLIGEQFGDDLNDELEEAFEFDSASLSTDHDDVYSGAIGLRFNPRFALELVGENYDDLSSEETGVTIDGLSSGDLELWSVMLMGKLYMLTERFQPYLMAGAGYIRGELESGPLDETADSALGRVGLGVETYLNENLAVGVFGAYSRVIGDDEFDNDELAFFNVGASLMVRF